MTYSLGAYTDIGVVISEEHSKDSGLFQMPMPGSNSSAAFLLDIFGASKTITISGKYSGTAGNIQTFITWLEGLVNGNQTTTKVFHTDKASSGDYNVYVMSVSWKSEEGAPLLVEYTIQMMEGA